MLQNKILSNNINSKNTSFQMKKELRLPNININTKAIYRIADANLNNIKRIPNNK